MRCKACDSAFGERDAFWHTVVLPDGKPLRLLEDLCRGCRDKVYNPSDDEPTLPVRVHDGED